MSDFLTELLNQENVIITSRPSAALPVGVRAIDLELETIGFYPDQVKDYIEKTFTDFSDPQRAKIDQSKVDTLQSFLQKHWLIQSLVRIPIQLDALCYTWGEFDPTTVPDNMTGIYKAIVQRLWSKDAVRMGMVDESYVKEAQEFEIEDIVEVDNARLECLAFNGLQCDIIDFTGTHRNEIAKKFRPLTPLAKSPLDETLAQLSFLRTSDPSSRHKDRTYHFIHLTFQEYFAASYFARQWKDKGQLEFLALGDGEAETKLSSPAEFLQKHKYTARYDIFWRFVAGLLDAGGRAIDFMNIIEKEPLDLLGPTHQRLVMHCLSEISTTRSFRQPLEEQLKLWLLFECTFQPQARLSTELEFPEHALCDALQEGADGAKATILESLQRRPVTDLATDVRTAVAQRLSDEDWHVRRAALGVLEKQSSLPSEILTTVIQRLSDENWLVRWAAQEVLKKQSSLPSEILTAIVQRLGDEGGNVRRAVLKVLEKQSSLPDEILTAVIQRLGDKNWDVRTIAREVLEKQLSLPGEILTAMVQRLGDENWNVRKAVLMVLEKQSSLPDEVLTAVAGLLASESAGDLAEAVLRRYEKFYCTILSGPSLGSLFKPLLNCAFTKPSPHGLGERENRS